MNQVKYDKAGQVTESSSKFYAEEILGATDTKYFVKTYASSIFDPYGPNSNRENQLDTKMKKVSYEVFKNYLTYLQSRNLKYLSLAQRGFISDRG